MLFDSHKRNDKQSPFVKSETQHFHSPRNRRWKRVEKYQSIKTWFRVSFIVPRCWNRTTPLNFRILPWSYCSPVCESIIHTVNLGFFVCVFTEKIIPLTQFFWICYCLGVCILTENCKPTVNVALTGGFRSNALPCISHPLSLPPQSDFPSARCARIKRGSESCMIRMCFQHTNKQNVETAHCALCLWYSNRDRDFQSNAKQFRQFNLSHSKPKKMNAKIVQLGFCWRYLLR